MADAATLLRGGVEEMREDARERESESWKEEGNIEREGS